MRTMKSIPQYIASRRLRICIAFSALSIFSYTISAAQPEKNKPNIVSGTVKVSDRNSKDVTARANVVIFIDGLTAKQKETINTQPHFISHKGGQFSPRVLPITKGETLNFFNDDNIFHNVFSLSKANTFDLGIYPTGTTKLVTFPQPGLVKIYCNIHPDMISNILVLNNSLFTQADSNGAFEIKNVPEGEFTLRIWHEFGESINRPISISGEKRFVENITLVESKVFRQHKNKFGKTYKKKY